MDFAKAFDIIDHDLLLRKLAVYGLSRGTLTLPASFLTDRKQTVHVNASISDVQYLRYGVPQGSVLGPLLFSIYINDFPLFIKACCELFADDTTIHNSNSNLRKLSESLQESVNSLLKWADLNHMSLHPDKNKCIPITTRQKRQNLPLKCPPISIGNQTVNEVDDHKVLGVTIDWNLSWSSHVTALCKCISKKIINYLKLSTFWIFMPENYFFMPIFNPLLTTDRRCWTQQVQILLNLWLVYIRERSRQFS